MDEILLKDMSLGGTGPPTLPSVEFSHLKKANSECYTKKVLFIS